MKQQDDAVIAGGGVIGLACAWRAARRGLRVRVIERAESVAAGATGVAAGMLAPVGEATWGEEALLELGLASMSMWDDFAAELERESGRPAGYGRVGALHVALDRDEAAELGRRSELHAKLELDSRPLHPSECRELEPGLATGVASGLHAPHEGAADPVALSKALAAGIEALGGTVELGTEVSGARFGPDGVELTLTGGRTVSASRLVVATGCWSGSAEWLPPELRPPVRPVKGEILTLRGRATRSASGSSQASGSTSSLAPTGGCWSAPRSRSAASTRRSPPEACTSCFARPTGCSPTSPSWSWWRRARACAPAARTTPR